LDELNEKTHDWIENEYNYKKHSSIQMTPIDRFTLDHSRIKFLLEKERDITVVSCSRTLHTYMKILKQIAESFKIDVPTKDIEKELIACAYSHVKERKTLYILIDEAHLLDMHVLRKLRLLFESFPKKHNLILFGQRDLLHYLSLNVNKDIKSRITYSATIKRQNDADMEHYIIFNKLGFPQTETTTLAKTYTTCVTILSNCFWAPADTG
ncbi:hypothetical protein MNBD_GAMMA13-845, partial [hydrothermal vent metagenome]